MVVRFLIKRLKGGSGPSGEEKDIIDSFDSHPRGFTGVLTLISPLLHPFHCWLPVRKTVPGRLFLTVLTKS